MLILLDRSETNKTSLLNYYSHRTCNVVTSLTLLCKASFAAWQVYTCPSISWVTFIFNSIEETVPPWRPGLEKLDSPWTGIPSFHQLRRAGGLLELLSQISLPSTPTVHSLGSARTFTTSGGTREFWLIIKILKNNLN